MSDLTNDEFTVLMLTAQGQSIMAIARWEKPTDSLVQKGLLARHDKFNHSITPAGQKAIEERDQQDDAALGNALRGVLQQRGQLQATQHKAAAEASQAVEHLVLAVRLSASATGDTVESACRQWSEQILKAALEKLKT